MSRQPSPAVRQALARRNRLIFGLPLADNVINEITEFWLVALNNRNFLSRKGMNLSAAHNDMVRQALALSEKKAPWDALVWLEHDHTFDYVTVFDYMERLDLKRYPVTGLLYVERMLPCDPVGVDRTEDGQFPRFSEERMAEFARHPGLHEVSGGVGMGVTIIAREVFEKLAMLNPEVPWYHAPAEMTGEMTDDVWFCQQAIAAGFLVHVETRFDIGHWGRARYDVRHYWAARELNRPKLDLLTEELIARRYRPPEEPKEGHPDGHPDGHPELPAELAANRTSEGTSEEPPEPAYSVREKRGGRV